MKAKLYLLITLTVSVYVASFAYADDVNKRSPTRSDRAYQITDRHAGDDMRNGRPMKRDESAPRARFNESSTQEIKNVQGALRSLGAEMEVDGQLDASTQQALRNFQRSNGLEITGQIDNQTKAKLGIK